ncbi:MAG TPA: aminoacyl-tRNA hydrolase [Bacteroidales bacterium]|jgi:PTH1 family peptidyl-tRNA hydrolase|nr:aminoacyl-tRNA hydrolase [Bacteroidales bacterium]HNR42979.1 aminoacyl-tRNA hydrolase [Bacteroidales bacterium]HPM18833.1 aminoacyl-tRNA hydrolase [Bacteroidales bacterium]HQG77968.1 aminoacyl-tRNA hydrolase [Bacteroidales bacterium]
MKYLIVGLGNTGEEYEDTRHNIGFTILDAFADASNVVFTDKRYGSVCNVRLKGRELILLKPSTYMNLSGYAVDYWMKREKIPGENLLVIVDDIALPHGSFRMRPKGGAGGHNGLLHINAILGTTEYARIRIGIGNGFKKGSQINFVLGKWSSEEKLFLQKRIPVIIEMIKSFVLSGTELTMTAFNKLGRPAQEKEDTPRQENS